MGEGDQQKLEGRLYQYACTGDRWYQTMAYGLVALVLAALVYYQLSAPEEGAIESVRLWWPVVIFYRTLGFWDAISCPSLLGLLFLGLGLRQLIKSTA